MCVNGRSWGLLSKLERKDNILSKNDGRFFLNIFHAENEHRMHWFVG